MHHDRVPRKAGKTWTMRDAAGFFRKEPRENSLDAECGRGFLPRAYQYLNWWELTRKKERSANKDFENVQQLLAQDNPWSYRGLIPAMRGIP